MEQMNVELRFAELFIIGVVVFIAVVMAEMWIDQQRQALAKSLNLQLSGDAAPALVTGFSGGV